MSIPLCAQRQVVTLLVGLLFGGVFAATADASPFAYVTRSGGVSVIDTATQAVITNVAIGPTSPSTVAANPNGTRTYVAAGGDIVVINTATHAVMATIPIPTVVGGIAVKPSGDFAYVAVTASGANDGWVSVIDTATNTITATIAPFNAPFGVAVTPDGSKLYVTHPNDSHVSVISTATNTVTGTVPVTGNPYAVDVAPNGARAYVTNRGGSIPRVVSVIDTSTDTVVATVNMPVTPNWLAVATDSAHVYVTLLNGTVVVIDTVTNTIVATVPVGSAEGIAVTPDGTQVYVAAGSSRMSVIDTATNTIVGTVPVGSPPVAYGRFIGPVVPPTCGNFSVEAGEQCDDGNVLNGDCCSATCQFDGSGSACTDGNPCTNDQCNGAGTCVHTNNTSACDDGLFCNGLDTCSGGACTTHPGDPCTTGGECADSCNESSDNCFDSTITPCTDDGNVCTNDRCNGAGVCGHPPNTAPCSDGVFCNGADTCAGGSCSVHGPAACPGPDGDANCAESCDEALDACTAADPNASPCDDGFFCNGPDACNGGTCVSAGDPCPGPDGDNDCAESCDEGSDTCLAADLDGSSCTDGDPCTIDESCGAGICNGGTLEPSGCADHYLCYKAKVTSGMAGFVGRPGVGVVDAFESGTADVQKPKALCPPADKNGEGILDPATHELSYQIKPTAKHVPETNIHMIDQFGSLRFNTVKPDRLFVPTTKGLGGPPVPPAPGVADHYKCYKVKITPGTLKFPKGQQATVADQFQTRLYDVKKPQRLCVPVSKNAEGLVHPAAHLTCYQVKPAKGQAKHAKVVGQIHTENQFGALRLDTVKEDELCVPAEKTP